MSEQTKLKLELSIDEINKILSALGSLPFSEVFELIGKINQQANDQLTNDSKADN